MNAIISAVRGPHAMISSNYSRPDLLNTFMPLSESSKAFLEVILVNP
ncbi:MAG TPA: hypothetical protein VK465_16280 [Fibrobacteria bacterium]|nr:hypothetical protein [Fibrobacteria bacterium]